MERFQKIDCIECYGYGWHSDWQAITPSRERCEFCNGSEAICELALDGRYDRDALMANGVGRDSLRRLDAMAQSQAMTECERVIREAQAPNDRENDR